MPSLLQCRFPSATHSKRSPSIAPWFQLQIRSSGYSRQTAVGRLALAVHLDAASRWAIWRVATVRWDSFAGRTRECGSMALRETYWHRADAIYVAFRYERGEQRLAEFAFHGECAAGRRTASGVPWVSAGVVTGCVVQLKVNNHKNKISN